MIEEQNNSVGDAQKKHFPLLLGIVFVALLGIVGFWWLEQNASQQDVNNTQVIEEESFGGDVFNKSQQQAAEDVTQDIPDANPLGSVESNPFNDFQNPFSN